MKRMLVSEKQGFPHQLLFFLGSDLTAWFFWIASGKHSADSSPNSESCVIISWHVKKRVSHMGQAQQMAAIALSFIPKIAISYLLHDLF